MEFDRHAPPRRGAYATTRSAWRRIGWWSLAVIALALLGTGLTNRLAPTSLSVPGSPSARAHQELKREFGNSIPVTVLLEGPAAQIDRQGPGLVAAFRREPKVDVISPWDRQSGESDSLRPRANAALIIVNFQRPESEAMSVVVPTAQQIVRAKVSEPLHAHVGGVAAIAVALQKSALDATHRAELIVAPILVIVLLLVFRSPVAAALPLLIGAATVVAGRGLLLIATLFVPINAIAVAIASMMGLALGVDYALLMVSRFRQEGEQGASGDEALASAAGASGQTIVFAGCTLAIAMAAAALVSPGDLLLSVAAGVVISALLSVVLAITLMPSLIRVLLPYLDRWHLPDLGRGGSLVGLAERAISRPWIAIPLVTLPMLAFGAPAAGLSMGPPDPRQLPRSDPTRQGFEALRKAIGPGWVAPYAVVATARQGPISKPGRLEAISRWQDRVARDPDVAAVIGPASLAPAESPVRRVRRAYRKAPKRLADAQRGIAALQSGLRAAGTGVGRLRAGLDAASRGATTIADRTRQAQGGAARLRDGIGRSSAGAHRLANGIERTESGSRRLAAGERRLSGGASRLARGLQRLDGAVRGSLGELHEIAAELRGWSSWLRQLKVPTELAAERLDEALAQLAAMPSAARDPRLDRLAAAIRQASALIGLSADGPLPGGASLPAGVPQSFAAAIVAIQGQLARQIDSLAAIPNRIDKLADGITRLRRGAERVAAGARAAERGGRRLRLALQRLRRGGNRLDRGLKSARAGSARLPRGLGAIADGADRLSAGLQSGRQKAGGLAAGLEKPQRPLRRYAVMLDGYERGYRALRARSPGAIDSGFLMLTALDGTVPGIREQIAQVMNLDGGAQSVRMLIVPKWGPSAPQTVQLGKRLGKRLPALARASGTKVGIGEGAQSLADYTNATMARVPWLVFALCLVSVLMLIAVLRSLLLPPITVALNLLTVAAAFGVLQLLFNLDLLVGPPYIDAISAAGVLTIMFVLSIDYEVFLLTRMREAWLKTRDHEHAIADGLRHTASVITGAAVIMSSVFLVFATTDIASLQQFGAGLTFAVVLDATLVRLVLLPAIMRAVGPRVWWIPAWLDRLVPQIKHDASLAVGDPVRQATVPGQSELSAAQVLSSVSHDEHRRLLDLLAELETANELHQRQRVNALARECRQLAEPHFRYEQQALFPHLVERLGPSHIEGLQAAQEGVVAALERIEALNGPIAIRKSAAVETTRLAKSARAGVISCDALSEIVEHQPRDVAERVLATREGALAGSL